VDEGGRAFWLVHGTRHPKGLEKMKDAMWTPIRSRGSASETRVIQIKQPCSNPPTGRPTSKRWS
jgi:hypothetical protein